MAKNRLRSPTAACQLRVNSTGQPFGYQSAWPNDKPALGQRSAKIAAWRQSHQLDIYLSEKAFQMVKGKDLIGSQCAFPLNEAISLLLQNDGQEKAIEAMTRDCPEALPGKIISFVQALGDALKRPIVFQLVDQKTIENEEEYIRYFGRLGQGGTPLSNDELTYSIIKHQYPEVHDRMKDIMDGPAGRIASEVNLVLAALRVAKVSSGWDGDGTEWKIIGRPNPAFVSKLRKIPAVLQEFQMMIPTSCGGRLQEFLEAIRHRLAYHKTTNPGGLPTMLLARLPHQLVDVLLLLQSPTDLDQSKNSELDLLAPFVLHWLLFVTDSDRAAELVFKRHRAQHMSGDRCSLPVLVQEFEKAGISLLLPNKDKLPLLCDEIGKSNHRLRSLPERFASLDADHELKTGDALRGLSGDREKIKRALLWLQRDYLAVNYPNFDPTSTRDEDLPIDLDHLIPSSKFGFHWKSRDSFIEFADLDKNFRWHRGVVGNSLGNYRWLDASVNRSRGDGVIEALDNGADFIADVSAWESLRKKKPWDINDAAEFQTLIDLRTVAIFEKLLIEGRLELISSDSTATIPPHNS
jgi:hypothetical protein